MKLIWSLFDGSGLAGHELAKQGHKVMCFNFDGLVNYAKYNARVEHPNIEYVNVFIDAAFERDAIAGVYGKPDFIMAFPPCTDLAVSGAAHFARKRERDPLFQEKAVATARIAANIGQCKLLRTILGHLPGENQITPSIPGSMAAIFLRMTHTPGSRCILRRAMLTRRKLAFGPLTILSCQRENL
ncbi:site specific DNA methylase [Shigella phage vB_SsoS_008]|nr:site specific DNA methylase [Shigella phage vB_SsoS_008]